MARIPRLYAAYCALNNSPRFVVEIRGAMSVFSPWMLSGISQFSSSVENSEKKPQVFSATLRAYDASSLFKAVPAARNGLSSHFAAILAKNQSKRIGAAIRRALGRIQYNAPTISRATRGLHSR